MSQPLGYFEVVNWETHQHYRDRRPTWIKVYNALQDDYAFTALPDAQKGQLVGIWLLASRLGNRMPWDERWIGHQIHATHPLNLDLLEKSGFIRRISGVPEPVQNGTDLFQIGSGSAIPEREKRREEREGEEDSAEGLRPSAPTIRTEPILDVEVAGWIPVVGVTAKQKQNPDFRQADETGGKKKRWERAITKAQVTEWREAYPGVDVLAELRKMRDWAINSPSKRKTPRGLNAFVSRWLAKEQDNGGNKTGRGNDGHQNRGRSAADRVADANADLVDPAGSSRH